MTKTKVTDIDASGTRNGTTFLRGDGAWAVPSGGGGGGGAITLLDWDGAVDPPFALSLALDLSGVRMLQITFSDVVMASAGWRTSEFSFDGAATWESAIGSLNYEQLSPASGAVGAAGSGDDSIWFIHSTATTAARSCQGIMWGLGFDGIKTYISNRDRNAIHLNRNVPTHVRVRGHLTSTTTANFTGGRISVVGYT